MRLTRGEFLKFAGIAAAQFHSVLGWSEHLRVDRDGKRSIVPMLYGSPRPETDLDSWFASMKTWGVRRWMPMLNDFRNSSSENHAPTDPVVPFLLDGLPEFRGFIDQQDEDRKARHILRQAELAEKNGIEFWLAMPFPMFPTQDSDAIRRALPSIFSGNRIDMRNPRLAQILQTNIRTLKKRIPSLKGVNIWTAEGAGGIEISSYDVAHPREWQSAIMKAFESSTRELGIGAILFAHNFGLTVGGRREVYKMAAQFPGLIVMEDITWPEEDMLHPFLGYLPAADRALLFRSNPVALNFLLDTEYLGQGVLPSVYPRWWKRNVSASSEAGAKVAMGRTFFWDGGMTDKNFNRLNAFIFTALCHNPGADEKELLRSAVRESFGAEAPQELVELLWETEPVIKDVVGINGVDPLSHSRFPPGQTIEQHKAGMKSVFDLFSRPGTPLYPPLTDALNNVGQWRWQNKIVSEPASKYLSVKQTAAEWSDRAVDRAKKVAAPLLGMKRELIVQGYEALNCLARAMVVYVRAADLYHRLAEEKTVDESAARTQFEDMASQLDTLAGQPGASSLSYAKNIREFAGFLRAQA